jgi:Uma2 family endonuclease
MAVQEPSMTVEAFDTWALDQDELFEYIGGRVVEKVASNPKASQIAVRFARYLGQFVEDEQDLGAVTGADGGYKILGERYIPDVAFIHKSKRIVRRGYNPDPSDIVVEVISADEECQSDRQREIEDLLTRVSNYLAAEIEVWIAAPDKSTLAVHRPGEKVVVLTSDDSLTSDRLPGFTLELTKVFH